MDFINGKIGLVDLVPESWREPLREVLETEQTRHLEAFLRQQYSEARVFPPVDEIFTALYLCPLDQVKAVIIGQDCYHGAGQAHGLAFSVPHDVKVPPSLRNILGEIRRDLGQPSRCVTADGISGNLEAWARQGVLLLNAVLTVRESEPASHARQGWEQITDAIVQLTSAQALPNVYFLWGAFAQKKAVLIDAKRHLILTSAHPSPLSANRGFFGGKHFSSCNAFLEQHGRTAIEW